MMFTRAIVCRPCRNIIHGLTSAGLGRPEYAKAVKQHDDYVKTLEGLGLEVHVMPADEQYADSVFVEDIALGTPFGAVITNPGAESRRGEVVRMEEAVSRYYDNLEFIDSSGTLDAGDVMVVGSHYYIGLSNRTSQAGAEQLIDILKKYDLTGTTVPLKTVLHLKSGVAFLDNDNLVVSGEFVNRREFRGFNQIAVPDQESYAANCLWVNGTVLVADGFPVTKRRIREAGYKVRALEVSEFRKLDGGLSCLSLRF